MIREAIKEDLGVWLWIPVYLLALGVIIIFLPITLIVVILISLNCIIVHQKYRFAFSPLVGWGGYSGCAKCNSDILCPRIITFPLFLIKKYRKLNENEL